MGNQIRKLETEFRPIKYLVSLVKYIPKEEVVLVFVEKSGSRFITRIKIDNTLSKYLSDINISLPLPAEKELYLKVMKVLGYFFYISVFLLIISTTSTFYFD
jgi:hypothetical protein